MDQNASAAEGSQASASEKENSQNSNNEESKNSSKENKTVPIQALHEERSKRKEYESRIAELEAKEAERSAEAEKQKEKKLKEEGKYKELLEEREKTIAQLTEQLEGVTQKVGSYEGTINSMIENSLSTLNKEDRTLVSDLLEGKTPEKKLETLPSIIKRLQIGGDFNKNPNESGKSVVDANQQAKEAAARGDVGKALTLMLGGK